MNLKPTNIGIHIKVKDIAKSREFYDSLGFKAVFAYGSEEFTKSFDGIGTAPEKYQGINYELPNGAKLEIADGHIAVKDKAAFSEQLASPKISAMINVESLVPLFDNPNLNITFPVRHYYWGSIEAALRDPDGFVLVFIAPFSDEELAAVKAKVEVEEVTP